MKDNGVFTVRILQKGYTMGLSCGPVGLPSSGKTVIFNAVTAAGISSYNGSEMNHAVVYVSDRVVWEFDHEGLNGLESLEQELAKDAELVKAFDIWFTGLKGLIEGAEVELWRKED